MADITPARWEQITELLGEALELTPEERVGFLERLRKEDPQSATEVVSLLEEHERPGEFLPSLPLLPQPDDVRGRMLGPYRLSRLLGSGGMGAVYLADRCDGLFTKHVAVKLLSPAFAHAHDRVHRERELLARLDHPNIARLIDAGATPEGWPYLVMDHVDGAPIDRYCAERDLPLEDRLQLLRQVCAGVAHAHQHLVVHCDIKPENILVTADGTVKLLDFGIAKLLGRTGATTTYRPGTPTYSSPEQLRGESITTASDVYSIGVLAYVILTGSWPYPARVRGVADAAYVVLTAEPVTASRVPGIPRAMAKRLRGDLDNILTKAVAKEPTRRYTSVEQLSEDLQFYCLGFPVRARADTSIYRLSRFVHRHRISTIVGVATLGTLIGLVALSTWQARIAERRFAELKEFAHAVVFDVNDSLATVPGTTAARKGLVETALRYLDRLSAERTPDVLLREELASAYIRIGRVQGGAFLPNLGDTKGAMSSFRKAIEAVGPAPASASLARLNMEAHLNIAQLATDPTEGSPDFDDAIRAGEQQLSRRADDVQTLRLVAQAYHGKATIAHLTDNVPDHVRNVRHAIELRERVTTLAPDNWQDQVDLAREYAQHALAFMQEGNAGAALARLAQGQALLESTHKRLPSNQMVNRGLAEIRSRSVRPLLALNRTSDAVLAVERAIALLEPLVESDRRNAQYESDLATAWLWLADARAAQGRLAEALELSQRTLVVRRRRAAEDSSMFVPWGLATNLNMVGELLMTMSPRNWPDARVLFVEARDVAERVLSGAPSFNEVRKELAISYEGLARVSMAQHGHSSPAARLLLEKSLATWTEVSARSVRDHRHVARQDAVKKLLSAVNRES